MWTNRIWLGEGFRKTTSNFNYVIIVHEKVFQINLMGTFIFFPFRTEKYNVRCFVALGVAASNIWNKLDMLREYRSLQQIWWV